jgi:hypothetical protein
MESFYKLILWDVIIRQQRSLFICFVGFNAKQNQPMIISCGHTVCSECLKMLKTSVCPFDRSKFDKDKAYKNIEVIQLIHEKAEIGTR